MKGIKVLLTGAGAPGMPGILKCLNKADRKLRLIGCDADSNAPSRNEFDAFYTIPKANQHDFISKLFNICKSEDVDIILPVVTKELDKISAQKQLFCDAGMIAAVMDVEQLNITNNKGLLFSNMEQKGILTPEYRIAKNSTELESAIELLGYPDRGIVIKPVLGNGSRGVRILDPNRSAYDDLFNKKPNGLYSSENEILRAVKGKDLPCDVMVMQLLPGTEYSVDIVAKNGETLVAVCRVGLAVASSNQTRSMVVDRPDIINYCSTVIESLKLSGNIGFDLKEDENGTVFILEINPRLTGGIVTCLAAGANMPWLGIKSWLNEPVQQPDINYGVVMQRFWNERFYDSSGMEISV